ncbi:hypothetical protein F2P79_004442 [Pimephales promelas]|nr:hypothetical protein F2P79_004442 [Pimephales promelas]
MRHDPNEKPIGQLDKINLLESILRKEQCFLTACTHVQREGSAREIYVMRLVCVHFLPSLALSDLVADRGQKHLSSV